jgi:hypothetical protein
MQDMAALRSEAFVGGWELDRHIKHKLRICEIDYILRPILEANRLSFPPISLNNYLTIGIIGKCYFFATRKNLNLGVENPIIIASKGRAFGSHFSQTGLVSDFGVIWLVLGG